MSAFKPMLAVQAIPGKLTFPRWCSPKLDGIRACIYGQKPVSRTLKVIPNLHIQNVLSLPQLEGLDGELCVGPYNDKNLMQRTTSGAMSVEGRPDFNYYVFDYWNGSGEGFDERIRRLNEAFQDKSWAGDAAPRIALLPQALVNDMDEMIRFEQICLEQGFEGMMSRKLNGGYKFGRSTNNEDNLIKHKNFSDGEAVVIGFQQFMKNENELTTDELGYAKRSSAKDGKVPMEMLGALIVKDVTSGIEFSIGTGYDMALRVWIWQNQMKVMDQFVTYKHFEAAGVLNAPRFPVFKAFRNAADM